MINIQGDSGAKVSILEGDNIGHCEKNHKNKRLILNGKRDKLQQRHSHKRCTVH